MIINDKHKFVFVHIPKCAGSAIRKHLEIYDDTVGTFTNRVEEHSTLGTLDYVHLPLSVLRAHFPDEFQKIKKYDAFSVIRDPFKRFPSSMSQRMKRYGTVSIREAGLKEIKTEIDRVIGYLMSGRGDASVLPAEYIHFQRQVQYVYIDGRPLVNYLYSPENALEMVCAIKRIVHGAGYSCADLDLDSINASVAYRNNIARVVMRTALNAAPWLRSIASENIKSFARSWLYVPQSHRLGELFRSTYVRDFLRSYYAADIKLFERVEDAGGYSDLQGIAPVAG